MNPSLKGLSRKLVEVIDYNMNNMKIKLAILLTVFFFLPSIVSAAPVSVTGSDLSDYRTTDPNGPEDNYGVTGLNDWSSSNGGFRISWTILNQGTYWEYTYHFTDEDGTTIKPDVSHWLLEVSSFITDENVNSYIWDTNFTLVGPQTWAADINSPNTGSPGGNTGNPNLPEDLYGIKLDTSTEFLISYTFKSTQNPIWGDFYAKNGKDPVAVAWNTGIGSDPAGDETDFSDWIPVPDTTAIPIPSAVWLLGSGLIAMVAIRRQRKS